MAIGCVCSTAGMFALGGRNTAGTVQQWLTIQPDAAAFNHVQIKYLPQAAGSAALLAAYPSIATGDLWVDTTAGTNNGVVKVW